MLSLLCENEQHKRKAPTYEKSLLDYFVQAPSGLQSTLIYLPLHSPRSATPKMTDDRFKSAQLVAEFQKRFQSKPTAIIRCPGRVNLIGEHIGSISGVFKC